jgi:uncharacterized protein (TIGR00369 family)
MTQTQPTEAPGSTEPSGPAPERTRSYSWSDPGPGIRQLGRRSGLGLLLAMIEGELPPPPILQTMAIDGFAAEEGRVTVYLTPQEFHYNPLGSVHGGVISTLLDTATGCAVHSTLPAGIGYTSMDLNSRFLRPVTVESGRLTCEGTVLSRGRRSALAQARLTDAKGALVAHATSTCLIFPIPAAE